MKQPIEASKNITKLLKEKLDNASEYADQSEMGDTIRSKTSKRDEGANHPKKKLYDLIYKVMKTQNEDLSPEKRNELVESELI